MTAKGFDAPDVTRVVAELKQGGFQSDYRFADSFVYNRVQRGYGPVRIRRDLRERGVADEVIDAVLSARDEDWVARLGEVHAKKFGNNNPTDYKEQMRRARFLQYRGFSNDQIRRLLNQD